MSPSTVSVVVPSYGRAALLERCVRALDAQRPAPNEVIVVYRADDDPTMRFVTHWSAEEPARRRGVVVGRPGLVHALIAGSRAAGHDVVAFIDDDALPMVGWLGNLLEPFADPRVGAVGGRIVDYVNGTRVTGRARKVGHVTWYGRIIWGHTLDTDHEGPVGFAAGANMAIRRDLVRFDPRLLHTFNGHAMANDSDACLGVWRAGYRVVYRPHAVVEHRATSFRDPKLGSRVTGDGVVVSAANHTYALLKHLPLHRRIALRVYGYVIGSATTPGPVRVMVELIRKPSLALPMARRVPPAWRGRLLAERMYREHRRGEGTHMEAVEVR